jgi:hypothetical protein
MSDATRLGLQPKNYVRYFNPDGGIPYSPGNPSFSEPTLLMLLASIATGEMHEAQPLTRWALQNRNSNGSMGLNRDFPNEGLWNTPLLALALHHLNLKAERDTAIEFILSFRSIQVASSPDNDVDTNLVGWSWVPYTFGWVEPTSWALLALALAGETDHPRAVEGRRLLENRCIREGGWNYGNKVVFNHTLMPFWDTTALALLALGDSNPELRDKNLALLEKSLPEIRSLLSTAMVCLCLARFGRDTKEVRNRIVEILANTEDRDVNLAHSALGIIALSQKRVFTL